MSDIIIFHAPEREPAARYLTDVVQAHGYSAYTAKDRDDRSAADDAATCLVLCCSLVTGNDSLRRIARTAAYRGKLAAARVDDCVVPWLPGECALIDLASGTCAARDATFDPLIDQLERLVGRPPMVDYRALRACHDQWTRSGAMTLQAYPLQTIVPPEAIAVAPPPDTAPAEQSSQDASAASEAVGDETAATPASTQAQNAPLENAVPSSAPAPMPTYVSNGSGPFRTAVGDGSADRVVTLEKGANVQDWEFAPELVFIPPGQYWMGSKETEGKVDEKPRHSVSIGYPLLVGKYPVTFDEWDVYLVETNTTFAADSELSQETAARKFFDESWGRGRQPVINVSWADAVAYTAWLSDKLGKRYRLLSEAEWEYVCRGGTDTQYFFGDKPAQLRDYAWYRENSNHQTKPVGSKRANAFGLHDVLGNIWEWCDDIWHESYLGAPSDGRAWLEGGEAGNRVTRGGSWFGGPKNLRSATRRSSPADDWSYYVGFRVAREVE